jgi:protein gp37
MRELLAGPLAFAAKESHIWWGVSVENRTHGLPRLSSLRGAPANVRFLSVEPLLENLGPLDLTGIHWMIVGGESGHGARPLDPAWVRSLRDQCQAAQIPFFFKQWGGVRKGKAGRLLDGQTHDGVPSRSQNPMPSRQDRLKLLAEMKANSMPK